MVEQKKWQTINEKTWQLISDHARNEFVSKQYWLATEHTIKSQRQSCRRYNGKWILGLED